MANNAVLVMAGLRDIIPEMFRPVRRTCATVIKATRLVLGVTDHGRTLCTPETMFELRLRLKSVFSIHRDARGSPAWQVDDRLKCEVRQAACTVFRVVRELFGFNLTLTTLKMLCLTIYTECFRTTHVDTFRLVGLRLDELPRHLKDLVTGETSSWRRTIAVDAPLQDNTVSDTSVRSMSMADVHTWSDEDECAPDSTTSYDGDNSSHVRVTEQSSLTMNRVINGVECEVESTSYATPYSLLCDVKRRKESMERAYREHQERQARRRTRDSDEEGNEAEAAPQARRRRIE
ncbi:protein ORF8 [Cyprinid herpesvirus 3]|nr:protein ORF8 [Cyprinid herpesvirus 3]AVL28413.1 protein ORF8 [Cyprinid herpesvirus 3]